MRRIVRQRMRSAAAIAAIAAGAVACADASNPPPRIDVVDPSPVSSLVTTPAVLRGAHFYRSARGDLGGGAPTIDGTWIVSIDDTTLPVADVEWIDTSTLSIVVPRGLSAGAHDVTVVSPDGLGDTLEDGLVVVDEPIGMVLTIEDAPGGAGGPVGEQVIAAGESFDVFAVVRDPAGAFVVDLVVDWSLVGAIPIGVLSVGPSSSATFDARTVGTGRIRAARPAAGLAAETGDVHVLAGSAAAVVIVDAPGEAGAPIGDRSDLTTDTDGGLEAHAIAADAFGNFVDEVDVVFTLEGVSGTLPAGAARSATIDFDTVGTGTLRIDHATLGGDTTGALTVSAGRAASLSIAPDTIAISADDPPVTFVATGTDADGNPTSNLGALTWSIASGPISAIDAAGVFDPTTAGTGTVSVTSSHGASAESGDVTVLPGRAAIVSIVPDTLTLSADDAPVTFGVDAVDGEGNVTTDVGTLTWSIASGPIAAIDSATGALDPIVAGAGTVSVTSSHGPSDESSTITILPGRAVALIVAPDTVTVTEGGAPTLFTATGIDGDGNATADLGTLTWSIASGPIGDLDPTTGVFSPWSPGVGTVRATSDYGPFDDTGDVVVLTEASLDGAFSLPAATQPGLSFSVSLAITNDGETDAASVVPCAPTTSGTGGASLDSGPTPASADIAAGASATFVWSFTATSLGSVELTSCASGVSATTGNPLASGAITSSPIVVQTPAALSANLGAPNTVGLGASFTVEMSVSNSGETDALLVAPSALAVGGGPGGAALISGPAPGTATVPAGGSSMFAWTYVGTAAGDLELSGDAAGIDAISGAPVTATTTVSNTIAVVGVELLFEDPFGDGTSFSFVAGMAGFVYLGPRASGAGAMRFLPDGSAPQSVAFAFPRDTVGNSSSNSSLPPYPSIGRTGCTANTSACGPDNEDGRGLFASGVFGGSERLVVGGARSGGDLDYVYMTTDTDLTLDFRFVDLGSVLGAATRGFSAMHVFNDRVYMGFPDTAGNRPYLIALATAPPAPGLNAVSDVDAFDLEADAMPGFDSSDPAMIDVLHDFAGRLYVANQGGCMRSTVAQPRSYGTFPGDWAPCTPTAAAFTSRISRTTTRTSDLEPRDRAFPQMATWNGRLYLGRNTLTGAQLWSCNPSASGSPTDCDGGDWSLVAPNTVGDATFSQFNDSNNTSITMVAASDSYLYVGYDNSTGIRVYRTSVATPSSQSDFELDVGGPGLGFSTNTKISDAKSLLFGTNLTIYLVTGNGVGPVRVYRIEP